jgi:hypothetical protein
MRFWVIYYALFGSWKAIAFVLAVLTVFFYCFVHDAFDSPRHQNLIYVPYKPKPVKLGLPPSNWKPANR